MDILPVDWEKVRPVRLGLEVATALRTLYPKEWQAERYDRLLVHQATHQGLLAGTPAADLERAWAPGLEASLAQLRGEIARDGWLETGRGTQPWELTFTRRPAR